jgi:GH43 family beta-xylosidase
MTIKYKIVRNTDNNPFLINKIENGEVKEMKYNKGETFELDFEKIIQDKDKDYLVYQLYTLNIMDT